MQFFRQAAGQLTMVSIMKRLIAVVFMVCASLFAQMAVAAPNVKDVEAAVRAGNYAQAESMLAEVIQAHPDSARAHYMYGQVLDHNGKAADGLAQIEQARTLDPSLKFTDASRFRAVERHVQADADAATRGGNSGLGNGANSNVAGLAAGNGPNGLRSGSSLSRGAGTETAEAAPPVREPSSKIWILFVIVIAGVACVLVWTVRRARSKGDGEAKELRLTQMRRATEVLNNVRTLKLDLRLSTTAGHEQMEGEAENLETDARDTVGALNGGNPVPDYRVEDLERRFASLRARADGRPDPTAAGAPGSGNNPSPYAQEADRFGAPPYPSYPNGPAGQPQVIVQQQPGGGSGLLTGVLLGSVLSGGFGGERERVVERDVVVDDDELRRRGGADNNPDPGFDPGQGGNDWDSGGGDVDAGGGGDDWSNR
jgi:Tetratricopeptide repeat